MLLQVQADGMALRHVPAQLRSEKLNLAAVRQNCWALRHVRQQDMTEALCQIAVKRDGRTLRYVAPSLRSSALCLSAVRSNPQAMDFVPDSVRLEVEFALAVAASDQARANDILVRAFAQDAAHALDLAERYGVLVQGRHRAIARRATAQDPSKNHGSRETEH